MRGKDELARFGPGATLAVITGAFLLASMQYRDETRAMPVWVGSLTLILLALELIAQSRTVAGGAVRRFFTGKAELRMPQRPVDLRVSQEWAAFAWPVGFLAVVMAFGFYIGIMAYGFSYLRLYAGKPFLVSLGVPALLVALLHLLFSVAMGYRLFYGWALGDI